jgi:hypothetical protein
MLILTRAGRDGDRALLIKVDDHLSIRSRDQLRSTACEQAADQQVG